MLASSGGLAPSRPEASPARELKVAEIRNNGPEARRLQEAARASRHRSVYLPLLRGIIPPALEPFDFAEQGMVTGRRETTTVAPQALYLLNDPFVRQESLSVADRLLARADLDDPARLELAYRLILNRPPTAVENERAAAYLASFEAEAGPLLAAAIEAQPKPAEAEASAPAEETAKEKDKKPMPVLDPDQIVEAEAPMKEPIIQASSPRAAAWASLCQALFGSGEFRYLR
jgi:hypothetical protein